jgi:putative colanic acid biosysnthesis UDP-glucose lipid carrier transferase
MKENAKPSDINASRAEQRVQPMNERARTARMASAPALNDVASGRASVEVVRAWAYTDTGGRPPIGGWSKRAFDVCVASVALIVLMPLLLAIAIAIRIDSKGNAIFKQDRGGFGGKPFRIWKFRTMTVTENRGVVQARRDDVRLTRLGGFLRRSSWDELPQLFNVLMGDMSIIGPRPHALEHDIKFEKVDPRYATRRLARPGVTGLAQVSGCRGPTETDAKIIARTGFDAEYVETWSWKSDIDIGLRTAAVLLRQDPGAL